MGLHGGAVWQPDAGASQGAAYSDGGCGDGTKAGLHTARGSMSTLAIAESSLSF
jgi:hypothetical protein